VDARSDLAGRLTTGEPVWFWLHGQWDSLWHVYFTSLRQRGMAFVCELWEVVDVDSKESAEDVVHLTPAVPGGTAGQPGYSDTFHSLEEAVAHLSTYCDQYCSLDTDFLDRAQLQERYEQARARRDPRPAG